MFIHEGLSVPTHKDEYLAHWPSTLSLLSYCSFVYWVVLCIDPFSRHSGLIDVTESCLFTEVCVRMRFTYLAAGFRILPQEIWHKDAIEHHFGLLSACLWTNERKHQPVSWLVKTCSQSTGDQLQVSLEALHTPSDVTEACTHYSYC